MGLSVPNWAKEHFVGSDQDSDVIYRFCATRGYGQEVRDYLLEKAADRAKQFNEENRSGERRYRPVTERWCEEQVTLMKDGPTLY